MARICINIIRDGKPHIINEDLEYAAQDAGFGDETGIIDQTDDCWTVDINDRRRVTSEQVESFKGHLEESTHAEVVVRASKTPTLLMASQMLSPSTPTSWPANSRVRRSGPGCTARQSSEAWTYP